MKFKVFIIITFVLIGWGVLSAQEISLQALIDEALRNNPGLRASHTMVKAKNRLIKPVSTLPDPMLSFGLMNLPGGRLNFTQEPMTGKQIGITQAIPFPGKLGLMGKIAGLEAEKSSELYLENKRQLILSIKQIYFDLFFVDRAIEVVKKNQLVVQNFIDVAQTRYAVGKGIQQDVLKAQLEYARFYDQLTQLQEKRDGLVAHLNALLSRPKTSNIPVIPFRDYESFTFNRDSLQSWLYRDNPNLMALEKAINQSEYRIRLARRNFWPDFTVTMAYTQREILNTGMGGTDFFSANVGLKLPIYLKRKQKQEWEARSYELVQIREQWNDLRNQLSATLEDVLQQIEKRTDLIELYETTIIPQASQSFESAMSGYQTDKLDFLTLLNNLMVLFNYEKEYYRLIGSYYQSVARLEYLTGKQWIQ